MLDGNAPLVRFQVAPPSLLRKSESATRYTVPGIAGSVASASGKAADCRPNPGLHETPPSRERKTPRGRATTTVESGNTTMGIVSAVLASGSPAIGDHVRPASLLLNTGPRV